MNKYQTMSIGEVVTSIPQTMEYFKSVHIDFCCGGYRPLADVINEVGLDGNEVYQQLAQIEGKMKISKTYDQMSISELCDYIVNQHHVYLREVLPQIEQYSSAVMRAHGIQHPELFRLGRLFGQLSGDLKQHLIKEEEILFPMLKKSIEEGIILLASDVIHEHEEAGQILATLRELTNNYTLPNDACATYAKLYDALIEMESDLHTHIHLENNILLKKFDARK